MKAWFIAPCRRCGELFIASTGTGVKKCLKCNKTIQLYKSSKGSKSRVLRVNVIRDFDTFDQASDALRMLKVPENLRNTI
nr:hypothetical protein [Candidatus Sigynarchaeota archaeon]